MRNICSIYTSPVGLMTIVNDGFYITNILHGNHSCDFIFEQKNNINTKVMTELDEYFNGSRKIFDIPFKFNGTDFQKKVWNALCKIPYGETRSYSEIADLIGKPTAIRAIGMANAKNPIAIIVPCHRVVNSNGSLAGYSGGIHIKKKLLELEKSTLTNINQKLIKENKTSNELLNIALCSMEIYEFYYYPQKNVYILSNRTAKKYNCKLKYENAPYSFGNEFVYSEDKEKFYSLHNEVINSTHSVTGIYRTANKKSWFKIILSIAEYDENENPITIVGIVEDITKEKLIELEKDNILNIHKEILSSLNHLFIGIHRLDLNKGTIKSIKSPTEIPEISLNVDYEFNKWLEIISKYYHPSDMEKFRYNYSLNNIIKQKNLGILNVEETYRRLINNNYYWISNNIIFKNENFNENIAIILQLDISQNHHKSNIIHALGNEYYAIYYLNLDDDIYEAINSDKFVTEKLNLKPLGRYSTSIKEYIEHFVHQDDQEKMTSFTDIFNLRTTLSKAQNELSLLFRKKVNNHYEWIQIKYIINSTDKDHFVTLAFKNTDELITQQLASKQLLKDALNTAEEANKTKSQFLSQISHDIRNPMTSIMGLTTLAKANINNPEYINNCLENISTYSQQLLSLLNQMLDMNRLESNSLNLQTSQFKFSEFIQSTLEALFKTMEHKNIKFNYHFKGITYENLIGDRFRLQQLLNNILTNAIKYNHFGGTIDLFIEQSYILPNLTVPYKFIIQDNGIGIDKSDINKIFQPFVRAKDTRISSISGVGLGLTIAYHIVKLMNGKIKVDSSINNGSTFTITFNLSTRENLDVADNTLPNVNVLVVNNNENELEYICKCLNSININTKPIYSTKDVLNELIIAHKQSNDYFAIIIDNRISDIYFLDLIKDIRKNFGRQPLKIFVSSYDFNLIENNSENTGIDDIIYKPIFKSQLKNIFDKSTSSIVKYYNKNPFDIQPLKNTKCMLIENNKIHQSINKEILKTLGSTVDIATNSYEAIDILNLHNNYDYILIDINVAYSNEYDIATDIKKINKCIPIIAMTSHYSVEELNLVMPSQIDAHILKPIDTNINTLINTILSNIELFKQSNLIDKDIIV